MIQYREEEMAETAMKAKSIPFNMRKIEIYCAGKKKEYPPEEHKRERKPYS